MSATHLTYTSGTIDPEAHAAFEARLRAARAAGAAPLPHVIADEPIADGSVFEREDPAHAETVASRAHAASAEVVGRAVATARAAAAAWRAVPYDERARRLRRVADEIAARRVELAAVVSLETGKTRTESILEVQEAQELILTYAGQLEENAGYTQALKSYVATERNVDTLRPYGVFGVIAPFNFPIALSTGMAVAALLAGNTVVFKPSEETPWTGALLEQLLRAAELPPGTFNLVHGGSDTGRALAGAAVDGIAFTGSAAVGREIVGKLATGAYPRPALVELGGKNPAIVSAGADLDKAAEGVARAAFGLSGQKCSACSRAIVVGAAYDEFVERLAAFTGSLAVGDPESRDSFLGPVVNRRSVARFDEAVRAATRDGSVVAGGGRPDLPGHYVAPTVVAGLPLGHPLTRDELFLPFVTVSGVATLDEAIAEANATDYGLTAGIFTEDETEAERFLDAIEAGIVYVNRRAGATTGAWPGTQSFCGWKSSGATGKGGLGPHYLPQFMREQSRTIVS